MASQLHAVHGDRAAAAAAEEFELEMRCLWRLRGLRRKEQALEQTESLPRFFSKSIVLQAPNKAQKRRKRI